MDILLSKFNLNKENEWNLYINIFIDYINEIYNDNKEILLHLKSIEYKKEILNLTNRTKNTFYIMKIIKNNEIIGFIDYVCYFNEDGKCIIGNFYIYPKYRNIGIGSNVCNLIENILKDSGGKFIEITPNEKALNLYLNLGYKKTDKILNNINVYSKKIANKNR